MQWQPDFSAGAAGPMAEDSEIHHSEPLIGWGHVFKQPGAGTDLSCEAVNVQECP